tara:strand:- start:31 stop:393 length:363 start_codon:yes stop_codon:yes gene_type:complete
MHRIEGIVKQVQPLEELEGYGKKRNILIEKEQKVNVNGETKTYKDIYLFTFWKDRATKLEEVKIGDEVQVQFVINSKPNEWKGKTFYNYNLKGINITHDNEVLNEHQNPDRVIEGVDLPF